MYRLRLSWFAAAPCFAYTHNPFYLVSTLLVLYGLHRSADAAVDWRGDGITIGLLFGYTLLLAVLAFAVVRLGKVWDDARTMLLVIVLLFLAISVRFDVIALRSLWRGVAFLFGGFLFAVIVSEGLLHGLGIRLAAMYRVPYYLLLALLFFYPVWLAKLSVDGQDSRMAWGVFLFPAIASALLLTLWPAARFRGSDAASGTPWHWPWFPWSLFAVMAIGVGLLLVLAQLFLSSRQGARSEFSAVLPAPLGLVSAFLLFELARSGNFGLLGQIALWFPLGLLLVAFPGHDCNKIAADFLERLCQHVGSPAQLTLLGLMLFYAIAWLRGIQIAQWLAMACLAGFAFTTSHTLTLSEFDGPKLWPLHTIALVQLSLAFRKDQLWRTFLPIVIEVGVALETLWKDYPVELQIYLAIHSAIVALLLAAALMGDHWSRLVRTIGAVLIPLAATTALVAYDAVFPLVPRTLDVAYVGVLTLLSLAYWYRAGSLANLTGAGSTIALLVMTQLRQVAAPVTTSILAQGRPWLIWGAVFLFVAVLISASKAGAIGPLVRQFVRLNDLRSKPKTMQ